MMLEPEEAAEAVGAGCLRVAGGGGRRHLDGGRRRFHDDGEPGQRQAAGRRRERVEQVLDEAPGHLLLEVVQRLGHHRSGRQRRRPLQRLLLLLNPRRLRRRWLCRPPPLVTLADLLAGRSSASRCCWHDGHGCRRPHRARWCGRWRVGESGVLGGGGWERQERWLVGRREWERRGLVYHRPRVWEQGSGGGAPCATLLEVVVLRASTGGAVGAVRPRRPRAAIDVPLPVLEASGRSIQQNVFHVFWLARRGRI